MDKYIRAKNIFTGASVLADQVIEIKDGYIKSISKDLDIDKKEYLKADFVMPGFLDLQIYGAGESLFSADLTEDSLAEMECALLLEGTTGFYATLATNTDEVVIKAIEVAKAYRRKAKGNFLGLHLEGPFLNVKRKGAHPENLIKKATIEFVKQILEQADGVVKMMTIAPELQDPPVLDLLKNSGILLSAGHSDATFEEAQLFFEFIPAATHLYNAMPPMHHRSPGLIPAIFDKKPCTSIVADGIHVDFEMIKLAKRLLGEQLFLITDAVTATNKAPYQHKFENNRYVMPDGTLSGSALSMLKAVKNIAENCNIELDEAIRMASLYPARLIKSADYGTIKAGQKANFMLTDEQLNWKGTVFCNEMLTA